MMETTNEINNNHVSPLDRTLDLYLVRINPACRIVWLYLLQNNIPHKLIDVDLSKPTSDLPVALKTCPHLEVPILIDGEMRFFEAPVILNYLSQTYNPGQTFLGADTPAMGMVTSLISWANSELHRCIGHQYVYPQFLDQYSLPDPSANEILVESSLRTVSSHLEKIETRYLRQTPYLCGQRVTLADMFVATVLVQLEWTGFDFRLWPKVKSWLHKVKHVDFWDTVHQFHAQFLSELRQKRNLFD